MLAFLPFDCAMDEVWESSAFFHKDAAEFVKIIQAGPDSQHEGDIHDAAADGVDGQEREQLCGKDEETQANVSDIIAQKNKKVSYNY